MRSALWLVGLFAVAAISDILDGWLARYLHEHTFLGACLDPIVDKLLVLSVFATLALFHTPLFALPRWFVMLVFIKESIIADLCKVLTFVTNCIYL